MEAHGGYLCRLDTFDSFELVRLARDAVRRDGEDPEDCSLLISLIPRRKVVRLAYDAPFTYGRRGANWYDRHHALAQLLSAQRALTVHAYVFDPDEVEEVVTYGEGSRVGGERMRYADAPLPDDDDSDLDELSFERMKLRWPLGRLATIYGVAREELIRIPRSTSLLLNLDGTEPCRNLSELLPTGTLGRDARRG